MDPPASTGDNAMCRQENNADGEERSRLQTFNHKPDDKTRSSGHPGSRATDTDMKKESSPPQYLDSVPNPEAEMERIVREMIEDFGPDRFAIFVYLGLVAIGIISIAAFFFLPWSWMIAVVVVLITFVVWRHFSLRRQRPRPETGRRWISRRDPSTPNTAGLPAVYFLYILGSGGHTSEMLETIKRKFAPQANAHRRYLVTTGDQDSLNRVVKLECLIKRCFPDRRAGTLDAFQVPRARRVHQPFWTAPFTCLNTAIHAINALTREPDARPALQHGNAFKYPHVVLTNGPATGFIVCLVAHLLKVFGLVPRDRLKMVYVESWARSRSLSLTGRLFLWSRVADMFCVQHEELARATPGAVYVGQVAARLAPPG